MGDGEGQGAAGGDVDLLAAGDFDVLFIISLIYGGLAWF